MALNLYIVVIYLFAYYFYEKCHELGRQLDLRKRMLRIKLLEWKIHYRAYSKNVYESLKKQYNLLYGIDYLEKQNETLQKIEKSLFESANQRRELQKKLNEIQEKIRDTRNMIDKTPRDSDNFMTLFQREHEFIKTEHVYLKNLKFEEEKEREMLSIFSENIRKAHQIDLVRQSRQKLLSFIYSIIGGALGFFLNAYLNRYKNEFFSKEIDKIKDEHNQTLTQLHQMDDKLSEILEHQTRVETALSKPKEESNSSSYLSYLYFPFVKMYRLVF